MIREAVERGRPLGEVLGAADELRKRLGAGSRRQKALVYSIADWPRSGGPIPIAEEQARQLWTAYAPPAVAVELAEMADEDSDQAFIEARTWACQKIAGASALKVVRRPRHRSGNPGLERLLIGRPSPGRIALLREQ